MPFRKRNQVSKDQNAVPSAPPVPGSAASIPRRPKNPDIDESAKKLAASLKGDDNLVSLCPGYGLGENVEDGAKGQKDRDPKWRIYAFLTDVKARGNVPAEYDSFPVTLRKAPVALKEAAWGRRAPRS